MSRLTIFNIVLAVVGAVFWLPSFYSLTPHAKAIKLERMRQMYLKSKLPESISSIRWKLDDIPGEWRAPVQYKDGESLSSLKLNDLVRSGLLLAVIPLATRTADGTDWKRIGRAEVSTADPDKEITLDLMEDPEGHVGLRFNGNVYRENSGSYQSAIAAKRRSQPAK